VTNFHLDARSQQPINSATTNVSHLEFWEKFRTAVIKGNKLEVANMSQFPISMPYGMGSVRNRAQLLRRYREVFNHEGSAAKCFVSAKPQIDSARPKEFTVGCKNSAGDEVVIYSFTQGKNGWKFSGLDNLNE
jgi:hypothetical protein